MSTKPLIPGKFYYLPLTSVYYLNAVDEIRVEPLSVRNKYEKVFFIRLQEFKALYGKTWTAAVCLYDERVLNLVVSAYSGFEGGEMRYRDYMPPPLIPIDDIDGEHDE